MLDENIQLTHSELPPLWEHQKQGIELGLRRGRFGFLFDPGTGKTRTSLEILKEVGSNKVLIIAPIGVCRNWILEFEKYLPGKNQTWMCAGVKKRETKFEMIKEFIATPAHGRKFLVVNNECLRQEEYVSLLAKVGVNFLIIDEFHNFKTPTSKQTSGLLSLIAALSPKHLYLLTGTPCPKGEMDLWSMLFLLGKTSDHFFAWRKKNFIDVNAGMRRENYFPKFELRKGTKELVQSQLLECTLSAKKDEVLDLPPLLRTAIYCELGPEQKRHYETMLEYLFAIDAEGNELNASNILSRSLRLRQILAGFLGEVEIAENPRIKALESAIEKTNGEQFVIWTTFTATYKQLAAVLDELGLSYGTLTGLDSPQERADTIASFQAGELRALIANPQAGGVGVNLTAASYSIFYTYDYSLVNFLQAEARNYRGGSERHNRITHINIMAEGTIDEDIMEGLQENRSVQDFILGLKRKYE